MWVVAVVGAIDFAVCNVISSNSSFTQHALIMTQNTQRGAHTIVDGGKLESCSVQKREDMLQRT